MPKQLHGKSPADLGLAQSVPLVSFPFPAWPLRSHGSVSEGGCPELLQRRGRCLPVNHSYPQLHLFLALLQLQGMLPAWCTAVWKVTAWTVSVPGQAVAAHTPVQDVLRLGLWLHYYAQHLVLLQSFFSFSYCLSPPCSPPLQTCRGGWQAAPFSTIQVQIRACPFGN